MERRVVVVVVVVRRRRRRGVGVVGVVGRGGVRVALPLPPLGPSIYRGGRVLAASVSAGGGPREGEVRGEEEGGSSAGGTYLRRRRPCEEASSPAAVAEEAAAVVGELGVLPVREARAKRVRKGVEQPRFEFLPSLFGFCYPIKSFMLWLLDYSNAEMLKII